MSRWRKRYLARITTVASHGLVTVGAAGVQWSNDAGLSLIATHVN